MTLMAVGAFSSFATTMMTQRQIHSELLLSLLLRVCVCLNFVHLLKILKSVSNGGQSCLMWKYTRKGFIWEGYVAGPQDVIHLPKQIPRGKYFWMINGSFLFFISACLLCVWDGMASRRGALRDSAFTTKNCFVGVCGNFPFELNLKGCVLSHEAFRKSLGKNKLRFLW